MGGHNIALINWFIDYYSLELIIICHCVSFRYPWWIRVSQRFSFDLPCPWQNSSLINQSSGWWMLCLIVQASLLRLYIFNNSDQEAQQIISICAIFSIFQDIPVWENTFSLLQEFQGLSRTVQNLQGCSGETIFLVNGCRWFFFKIQNFFLKNRCRVTLHPKHEPPSFSVYLDSPNTTLSCISPFQMKILMWCRLIMHYLEKPKSKQRLNRM